MKLGHKWFVTLKDKPWLDSLAYQPLLVKPNNHDPEAIFNVKLNGLADVENMRVNLAKVHRTLSSQWQVMGLCLSHQRSPFCQTN